MKNKQTGVALPPGRFRAPKVLVISAHKGVGMLEFLIALLIFSTGMLGLLSAQLAGKRVGYEALQRSVATALARDILERIRINPGRSLDYRVIGAGSANNRAPVPGVDCDRADCSAAQLAAFDLWQWESQLLGASARDSGINAGGLVLPRACITNDGGVVDVAISWQGVTSASQPTDPVCANDEDGINVGGDHAMDDFLLRNHLRITTFIAE
jgi:type IV pilus assembly protein PilV